MIRTGRKSPQQIIFNGLWTNRILAWARSGKPCPKPGLGDSQGNVLFNVLRPGCLRAGGRLFQSTELNIEDKQDKMLSLHQLVSILEWGELATHLPAVTPLVKSHPFGCFREYMEILCKLNGLIAVTSYAVRTWAYSNITHLWLAQAAIGKGTCPLPKWQSPPSTQSHPAMEEDAFPTSEETYLVLTSSQGI